MGEGKTGPLSPSPSFESSLWEGGKGSSGGHVALTWGTWRVCEGRGL